MAEVEVITQSGPVVEIIAEDGLTVEVLATPTAMVEVLTDGTQGVRGLPGEEITRFEQAFAASPSWTVNHNLARHPGCIRVLTEGGVEVDVEIVETTINQIVVVFAVPMSGRIVVF